MAQQEQLINCPVKGKPLNKPHFFYKHSVQSFAHCDPRKGRLPYTAFWIRWTWLNEMWPKLKTQ